MSFKALAALVEDHALTLRVAACAATLGEFSGPVWARSHAWEIAATPGWAEVYQEAIDGDGQLEALPVPPWEDPAARPTGTPLNALSEAITDAMILEAVSALLEGQRAEFAPAPDEDHDTYLESEGY